SGGAFQSASFQAGNLGGLGGLSAPSGANGTNGANNANGLRDLGSIFGLGSDPVVSDVGNVLNDSSLTVEDKITLMLMMIMEKMDQDIEAQGNYINALQQQQQAQQASGGQGGGGGAPSIDVETMKLKRLIDKRSQMFDMLRQIIDKYNQTAKGII